jgi:hypothetical protein
MAYRHRTEEEEEDEAKEKKKLDVIQEKAKSVFCNLII